MNYLKRAACLLTIALLSAGCDLTNEGDDDLSDLEGTWSASIFLLAADGETYDILEEGGDIQMTLNEDGTVEDGLMTAPCTIPGVCADDEEGDLEVMFEGTFDRDGSIVRFDHDEDTFIRGVDWTFNGTRLTTSTANLSVALER